MMLGVAPATAAAAPVATKSTTASIAAELLLVYNIRRRRPSQTEDITLQRKTPQESLVLSTQCTENWEPLQMMVNDTCSTSEGSVSMRVSKTVTVTGLPGEAALGASSAAAETTQIDPAAKVRDDNETADQTK